MALPLKKLDLDFTLLEFHKEFVLSKLRDGQVLELDQVKELVRVCLDFYKEDPFVYLSLRVNDYNVNPTVYINLDKVYNLAGIGIVSEKTSSLNMAYFEKKFSKIPFEIFMSLKEGEDWARKMVEVKRKKADL